eukprot:363396-Chlamydomonas_euryale.AAC.3
MMCDPNAQAELKEKLASMYDVKDQDCIFVFGFRTQRQHDRGGAGMRGRPQDDEARRTAAEPARALKRAPIGLPQTASDACIHMRFSVLMTDGSAASGFGGGKSTGFGLIYNDKKVALQFEPKYRLIRNGLAKKVDKSRKQKKERRNRARVIRGTKKHGAHAEERAFCQGAGGQASGAKRGCVISRHGVLTERCLCLSCSNWQQERVQVAAASVHHGPAVMMNAGHDDGEMCGVAAVVAIRPFCRMGMAQLGRRALLAGGSRQRWTGGGGAACVLRARAWGT